MVMSFIFNCIPTVIGIMIFKIVYISKSKIQKVIVEIAVAAVTGKTAMVVV